MSSMIKDFYKEAGSILVETKKKKKKKAKYVMVRIT